MKATILSVFAGIILFRLTALVLGCFYGPYIYAVLPLGGLYLTLDILTAYSIHASDDEDHITANEKTLSVTWCLLNFLAIIGLIVAAGFFLVDVGIWSMTYVPIHLAQFVIICCLSVLLAMGILLLVLELMRKGKATDNAYKGLSSH